MLDSQLKIYSEYEKNSKLSFREAIETKIEGNYKDPYNPKAPKTVSFKVNKFIFSTFGNIGAIQSGELNRLDSFVQDLGGLGVREASETRISTYDYDEGASYYANLLSPGYTAPGFVTNQWPFIYNLIKSTITNTNYQKYLSWMLLAIDNMHNTIIKMDSGGDVWKNKVFLALILPTVIEYYGLIDSVSKQDAMDSSFGDIKGLGDVSLLGCGISVKTAKLYMNCMSALTTLSYAGLGSFTDGHTLNIPLKKEAIITSIGNGIKDMNNTGGRTYTDYIYNSGFMQWLYDNNYNSKSLPPYSVAAELSCGLLKNDKTKIPVRPIYFLISMACLYLYDTKTYIDPRYANKSFYGDNNKFNKVISDAKHDFPESHPMNTGGGLTCPAPTYVPPVTQADISMFTPDDYETFNETTYETIEKIGRTKIAQTEIQLFINKLWTLVKVLRGKIIALKAENSGLKAEVQAAKDQISKAQGDLSNAMKAKSDLEAKLADKDKEIADAKSATKAADDARKALENQVANGAGNLTDLTNKLTALENAKKAADNALAAAQRERDKLKVDYDDLMKLIDLMRSSVKKSTSDLNDFLSKNLASINATGLPVVKDQVQRMYQLFVDFVGSEQKKTEEYKTAITAFKEQVTKVKPDLPMTQIDDIVKNAVDKGEGLRLFVYKLKDTVTNVLLNHPLFQKKVLMGSVDLKSDIVKELEALNNSVGAVFSKINDLLKNSGINTQDQTVAAGEDLITKAQSLIKKYQDDRETLTKDIADLNSMIKIKIDKLASDLPSGSKLAESIYSTVQATEKRYIKAALQAIQEIKDQLLVKGQYV